eukprot:GEZU01018923.1.p2 GENE.GEZU01018923.1~~GEZU01018923.1.p2  ORF type:complete len:101 (+),score=4.97 GEZU01018923.1:264-566(+)
MITTDGLLDPPPTARAHLEVGTTDEVREQVVAEAVVDGPPLVLFACGPLMVWHLAFEAIALMALFALEIVVSLIIKEHIAAIRRWTAAEVFRVLLEEAIK